MTEGQRRALRELQRLSANGPNDFELVGDPEFDKGHLRVTVTLRIGAIETREGGLDLRDREEFQLSIPPGFPFDRPSLSVAHWRFSGFPHVIWSRTICLYQSVIEWNPSDGLYGFFDRLRQWLAKAAINDMDPIEGPLEPPHHSTDTSQVPFVIRANAPCKPGETWSGLALLERSPNRIELVGWNDLSGGEWPQAGQLAFAVVLPGTMPMEFPLLGKDLLQDLQRAGMDSSRLIANLGLSALLTPKGEPVYLIVGLPMRRAADGSKRIHFAVWSTEAEKAEALRAALPQDADTDKLRAIRGELADALRAIFELSNISWCRVLDDRSEIVRPRDTGTPLSWFAGKRVLVLGCGALGSWAAEFVARARARAVHVLDSGLVKPGLLVRQNYTLADIGASKAPALARRLREIAHECEIVPQTRDAHNYLLENTERLSEYDVVLDCTASSIFQMKLERDWARLSATTPLFLAFIIDGHAQHSLCVVLPRNSPAGIWDAFLTLKMLLCNDTHNLDLLSAFYSERASAALFQPEPGCSDPTFAASSTDVVALASTALTIAAQKIAAGHSGFGLSISATHGNSNERPIELFTLSDYVHATAGMYRVRIAKSLFTQARGWVNHNNRRRSRDHETGGLLWGHWDDAIQVIWIFALSAPPPDSRHDLGHFICGTEGTLAEHQRRAQRTFGTCGFIGHWHTHPNLPSKQSAEDIRNMAILVSSVGANQKRSIMLIFGRTNGAAAAGLYVYESQALGGASEFIAVGMAQIALDELVA